MPFDRAPSNHRSAEAEAGKANGGGFHDELHAVLHAEYNHANTDGRAASSNTSGGASRPNTDSGASRPNAESRVGSSKPDTSSDSGISIGSIFSEAQELYSLYQKVQSGDLIGAAQEAANHYGPIIFDPKNWQDDPPKEDVKPSESQEKPASNQEPKEQPHESEKKPDETQTKPIPYSEPEREPERTENSKPANPDTEEEKEEPAERDEPE
jgi:hypothetical protein